VQLRQIKTVQWLESNHGERGVRSDIPFIQLKIKIANIKDPDDTF